MNLHLTDKIALVTGGASGIGEAIVRLLAAEGATPVIADKNADAGLALANDLREQGLRCAVITTDVTREEEIKQCIQHVTDEFRGIDILVNNAAANDVVSLAAGATAFRASLERNLVSVYNVTHYAAASLRARRGAIVNIGSKVASTGQGGTSGYAASKGGVNALTREWAVDLLPHGVRVNAVIPAEVWTPMYERWLDRYADDPDAAREAIEQLVPLEQRMTRPSEIADAVAFLASDRAKHITGQLLYVDGGYTHLDRKLSGR